MNTIHCTSKIGNISQCMYEFQYKTNNCGRMCIAMKLPLFLVSLFSFILTPLFRFFFVHVLLQHHIIRTLTKTNQHQIFYVMHRKSSSKTKKFSCRSGKYLKTFCSPHRVHYSKMWNGLTTKWNTNFSGWIECSCCIPNLPNKTHQQIQLIFYEVSVKQSINLFLHCNRRN